MPPNRFLAPVILVSCGAGGCAGPSPSTRPVTVMPEGSAKSPFVIRGWQAHDYDMEYLESIIDRAPAYGINHLQLSHTICHHAEHVLNDVQRQEDFRKLARLAHRHGIRVHVWTHELQRVPKRYRSNRRVNLDDEALWQWLRAKYERLFGLIPEVDGIILTFHETETPVYADSRVISSLSVPARVTKLLGTIHAALAPLGKTIYARTFVRRPDELAWLIEGISSAHPEVRVMTKVVPRDWHQFGLKNPAIGVFGDRIQVVELDPAAEYYGQGKIPFCFVGEIKEHLNDALRHGADGAVARIDRLTSRAFGSGNELNLYAFSRLLAEPTRGAAEIERGYFSDKYGPGASEALIEAFRRTAKVIPAFYLAKRFYFLNRHSRVPELGYATGHIVSHSPVRWDPTLKRTEQLLLRPTEAFYNEIMEEKQYAIELAEASVQDVESVEDQLPPEDYQTLKEWFEKELRCALLWKRLTAVFFRGRMYEQNKTNHNRQELEQALAGVSQYADWLEEHVGPDADWESAVKARQFREAIRQSVGLTPTSQP